MPKSVQGVYRNGEITLIEEPEGIAQARVIVTFLTDDDVDRLQRVRLDDLRAMRADILIIAAKYGASNVRVFGSVARNEAGPAGDVDFLVDMEPERSLLDLSGLRLDLQRLLGRPVDVGTPDSLRPVLRERVLREATPL